MGATDFTQIGQHTDVRQAFALAHQEARYEYGNGGYSGTLAEKDDFIVIQSTPVTEAEAFRMAERLINNDDPRIVDKWGPAGAIAIGAPLVPPKEGTVQLRMVRGKELPHLPSWDWRESIHQAVEDKVGHPVEQIKIESQHTKFRHTIGSTEGPTITKYQVVQQLNSHAHRLVTDDAFSTQAQARSWLTSYLRGQSADTGRWKSGVEGTYGVIAKKTRSESDLLVEATMTAVHADFMVKYTYYPTGTKLTLSQWLFFGWASS